MVLETAQEAGAEGQFPPLLNAVILVSGTENIVLGGLSTKLAAILGMGRAL
jgi:hypothetical protein